VDKAADAGQQHMEGAVAELAAIPALQDAVPLQAAGPQCCRRGPVSRRSSLQRYRTVTRKGTQNKSSVVDAYCDSFYFQQFVAEREQSAARDQVIIHTDRFYRESAALLCSAFLSHDPLVIE
jgi:hypothetical protein